MTIPNQDIMKIQNQVIKESLPANNQQSSTSTLEVIPTEVIPAKKMYKKTLVPYDCLTDFKEEEFALIAEKVLRQINKQMQGSSKHKRDVMKERISETI